MADVRLESFPFDSNFDGYDAYGYPVFDRAVSARTYRYSLEQFFSDGVFGTPANALQISKGTGLNVVIQPGIGIIRGGIGGVFDDPATLELDTAAPQGNVAYAIMLRCDDNDDKRSFYLHVEKGTADANPTPPEPTVTDIIKDLRLGYVVVPSGATDLTNATVTNEKGLSVCPYAAPFEEIDVDGIVGDFRVAANEALTSLLAYFESNKETIDAALDGTAATHLQTQITALQEQLENFDLSGSVDNVTVEYSTAAGEASAKLRVKDGGIGTRQIADGSVTLAKFAQDAIDDITKPKPGRDIGSYSWQELSQLANEPDIELSDLDYLIGQSRNILIAGYGTFAFQLIGIDHDSLASGGTSKLLTFQSIDVVCNHNMNSSDTTSGGWASSAMRTFMNGELLSKFPQYIQDVIVEVKKPYCATKGGSTQYSNDKLFIASEKEIFGTSSYGNDGTQYEFWSVNNTDNARIKKLNGSVQYWWMRSVNASTDFRCVQTDGRAGSNVASAADGCVPCFCI